MRERQWESLLCVAVVATFTARSSAQPSPQRGGGRERKGEIVSERGRDGVELQRPLKKEDTPAEEGNERQMEAAVGLKRV